MTPIDTRKWYRVMLCFPVETQAESLSDAIEEAMAGFLSELDANGLDVAHDLLATDANDVYPLDTNPLYDDDPTN